MPSPPKQVGRYVLFGEIASGGMGAVHLGRLIGPGGFSRIVAVKSLHPFGAGLADFTAMLLDEARLASRVRHPNVVPILDVVEERGVHLVMEYVEGDSLSQILKARPPDDRRVPAPLALAIAHGVLEGLHAAHEAKSERGTPLGIVHRDVSPQNVLLGADGVPRLIDFGVAKAHVRLSDTKEGTVKGKVAYMAPELLQGASFDRRVDVYAMGVVLWEMLVGERLFDNALELALVPILEGKVTPPSQKVPGLPPALDAVVMRALAPDPARRFATAAELAEALEPFRPFATSREIATFVRERAHATLSARAALVADAESYSSIEALPASPAPLPEGEPARARAPSETPPPRALAEPPAAPPARRGATWLAVGLAVLLGGASAFALRGRARPADAPPREPQVARARADGGAASAPPVASPPPVPAPSSAPPATSGEPAASASATAAPAAAVAPPLPPRTSRAPAPSAAPARAPSCDPPFSLSPSGVKIPKPGCF